MIILSGFIEGGNIMKRSKKFAGFVLAASICNFITSLCVSATVYEIDLTGYPQQEDVWCYAACAETSAKHSYPYSPRNQEDAVIHVKGNRNTTQGGTLAETEAAAEFICYNYLDYRYTNVYMQSEQYVYNFLNDRATIIARYPQTGSIGHMVVASAIVIGTNGKTIYYYDPAPHRNQIYAAPVVAFNTGTYDGYEVVGGVYAQ